MDKEDVYINNGRAVRGLHEKGEYSAVKKNEILPFVTTWMNLECIMLSEINQRTRNVI